MPWGGTYGNRAAANELGKIQGLGGESTMKLEQAAEQPYGVEIKIADDILVKQMFAPKAGTIIPQHGHTYDHTSMLAFGSVEAFVDGKFLGKFTAPTGITIKAKVMHAFMTLEDNTVMYCIHNISRTGEIDIHAEHNIV